MPTWLEIAFAAIGCIGGLSGIGGLFAAFIGFGRVLERVGHLADAIKTLPDLVKDVAYIKGRIDGRQEGLEEVKPATRRTRPRLAATNG